METIENAVYRDEIVAVDGKEFKKCDFYQATLVYAGGELPTFVDCQFRGISLQFEERAANTLNFLSGLRKGGFATAIDKMLNGVRTR